MKKLSILFLFALLISGCNDLFDKGDVEKVYDGPDVVAFFPLQLQTRLVNNTATVQVQLIGRQRSSDLSVAYTVDPTSTAVAGVHYNITTPSPVTIAAGSSAAPISISMIGGSLAAGEVRLILNLDGAAGVDPAENLKRSTVFIRP
jgi:hypothetical protein